MRSRYISRWVILGAMTLFSLLIGLHTSVRFFFFFSFLLFFCTVLGLAVLAVSFFTARLVFELKHPFSAETGDTVELESELSNRGMFPLFNLFVQVALPSEGCERSSEDLAVPVLAPEALARHTFSIRFNRRGRFVMAGADVYFFDPFGLFFLKKRVRTGTELYVLPRTFTVSAFPPMLKGNAPWFGIDAARRAGGDEEEFFGIRDYHDGDPLKTIHWVSSARRNKLIVKQFQRQSYFRATIIFNLEKEEPGVMRESASEYVIKIAASVAKYLLARDVAVEMITHTGEIYQLASNKGQEHMDAILKFLTVATCDSEVGFGEVFQEFYRYIPAFSNLIVIMQDKDWDAFLSVMSQETKDLGIMPVILISSSFLYEYETSGYAAELKVKLYNKFKFNPVIVSCGDDLEQVFS